MRKTRSLLPLLALLCPLAHAAVGSPEIAVTNTQAVIRYRAPDDRPCQVRISEQKDLAVPVNDVDPAKFADADSDARSAGLNSGTERIFVAGKRAAERAKDGLFYSRALQALTAHYFQITCGTETKTGEFTTANLMLGNTYTEPQPVDPAHPGDYAWPALSFSDRSQKIVDPQTGLLIRRISLPGDRVITEPGQGQRFQFARSSTWSDPAAALSTTGGTGASISGNNSGTLLLTPQNNEYAGYISFFKANHGANLYTLNSFQVMLTASTDLATCDAANTDDCKIVACLTIDGVSCYAGARRFELPLTPKHAHFTLGSLDHPIDLWQTARATPPSGVEIATRIGQVKCDGSPKVVWEAGNFFAPHWTAGSTVTIDKKDYTVASLEDTRHLTLTTACPAGPGKNYAATNFGVLIRKKTASANRVSVESSSVNYQMGVFPSWDYTGAFDLCSDSPVKGASGRPGYHCVLPENGLMYWIDAETGEAHLFSRYQSDGTPATNGCGNSDSQIFDDKNPDIWYCGGSTVPGSPQHPYRVQYFGNHLEPSSTKNPGRFEESEGLPKCDGASPPRNQPCLAYSPITTTADLGTLTASFDPSFQKDRFRQFYLVGLENGVMVFRVWRGAHNSIGWTVVFDPNATSNQEKNHAGCVGDGKPGCVIAAVPSWKRPGARWCALKGNDPMSQNGWLSVSAYIWGAPGDTGAGTGPYQADVVDGQFTKTLAACPPNRFGATGTRCTVVKVAGEPRDASPCTASLEACGGALETGAPGEIGTAEPGDEFTAGPAGGEEEVMRLIAKSGPDHRTWTFERGMNGRVVERPPNTPAFAFCAANPDPRRQSVGNLEWYWNYADDPHGLNAAGKTILGDRYSVNAHFFVQNGVKATGYTEDKRCVGVRGQFCYQVNMFQDIPGFVASPPTGIAIQNPVFAGKLAPAFPNQVQQHPAGPGVHAPAEDHKYFFDARPFNGSPLSGSLKADGSQPATAVEPHLYKFTADQVGPLDRKFLPTFAFSGSKPLLDVSGPGSRITGAAAESYRYCVAALAGECRQDSRKGDVYVNAPFVFMPFCHHPGQADGMPDEFDLCIGNNAMVYNSVVQIGGEGVDLTGAHQRMVTKALSRNRLISPFWHSHSLANARWALVKTDYAQGVGDMLLAVKIPPPPAADTVDRGNFIPLPIRIKAPEGVVADNALVEFGYGEYGAPGQFYCTSRAEACAVGAASNGQPFSFETSEAAKLTGIPCSQGCQITVPAVSQRVLFARPVFRDQKNQILQRGPVVAVVTP